MVHIFDDFAVAIRHCGVKFIKEAEELVVVSEDFASTVDAFGGDDRHAFGVVPENFVDDVEVHCFVVFHDSNIARFRRSRKGADRTEQGGLPTHRFLSRRVVRCVLAQGRASRPLLSQGWKREKTLNGSSQVEP